MAVADTDERVRETDIAVIGMSGRFPGAADVEAFWRNIASGTESIRRFSREELLAAGVDPIQADDPAYVPARPVLDDVRGFDAAFFRIGNVVNVVLAAVLLAVYHLIGLRHGWTWALLTAIACYVPYLGPIVAGIPPILDAFISCPSLWYPIGLLVFYVGIVTLEGYIIVPVVMGRSMELNATTVMLACLFWELVWGLPGLFLAMPLMAAVKAICYHVPGWRPWANLMGTRESDPIKADEEEEEGEGEGE